MKTYEIVIAENAEDPEIGGFFAYDGEPYSEAIRGWGLTIPDAVGCLLECLEENESSLTPVAADAISFQFRIKL